MGVLKRCRGWNMTVVRVIQYVLSWETALELRQPAFVTSRDRWVRLIWQRWISPRLQPTPPAQSNGKHALDGIKEVSDSRGIGRRKWAAEMQQQKAEAASYNVVGAPCPQHSIALGGYCRSSLLRSHRAKVLGALRALEKLLYKLPAGQTPQS